MSINDLKSEISAKALLYLTESDTEEVIPTTFPTSIVDFVIEYAYKQCHFPKDYNEDKRVSILSDCKFALAMACVDVYSKIGNEGQTQYSANGIQRIYKTDWINSSLLDQLPNYVGTL